ncbi:MAG: prepilin peptidase [Acidimicrobiales bacterium]
MPIDTALVAVCAASGLVLGESLEVPVRRLGAKESPAPPYRSCPACGHATWRNAVPFVRMIERRSCSSCGARADHAWRPVALGVVGAAILGVLAARIGADVMLGAYCVLALGLLGISAVDLERYIIPSRMLYPTLGSVTALLLVSSAVDDRWGSMARAAIAGVAAFVAFFAVHLAVPKGMGFGDVRLAGVVGISAGWLGLGHAFVAFFAAFVLGAVIGTVVMLVSGGGRKTRVPFGPFLAAGAFVSILWGNPIVRDLFHRGA